MTRRGAQKRELSTLSIHEEARQDEEKRRWLIAITNYQTAKRYEQPFDPAEIGFEFSVEEIAHRDEQRQTQGAIEAGRYYEYKAKGYIKTPPKAA